MFENKEEIGDAKKGVFVVFILVALVVFWGLKYNFAIPASQTSYNTDPKVTVSASDPLKDTPRRFDAIPRASQTNVLARDFIDLYLQARDENPEEKISESEQSAIASSLAVVSREKYLQLADPFLLEDLNVQQTETIERLTTYFDAFGKIFGSAFPEEPLDNEGPRELVIFFSAISSSDFSQLESLTPYMNRHGNTAASLASLRVPEQFSSFHLEATNTFANVALALSYMQNYEEDPVGALFGVDQFSNEVLGFILSLGELRDTLTELSLPFTENSDGALFELYLQTI